MFRINFLSYTGQVLGCFAGAVLIALAVNGIKASASISGNPANPDISRSTVAVYPVRVGLFAHDQSSSSTYPLRIPLSAMQSCAVYDVSSRSNLLFAAALQLPEGVLDFAAKISAAELADIEESPDSGEGKEVDLTPPPGRQRSVSPEISGQSLTNVINVKYDLDAQFSGTDGLAIRKPLIVNGVAKGQVTLRIVRDSTIVARLADLELAFGETAIAELENLAVGTGYVDFDQLRTAGVDVRYDAARDAVIMTGFSRTG